MSSVLTCKMKAKSMKKTLLATTAMFVFAGVSTSYADITLNGYSRFTLDTNQETQDPDFNIWVKAEDVNDNGMKYGGAIRFTPDDEEPGSRHYLWMDTEVGKMILGKHHGPAYTMSLGSDWRGTVSASGKATTPIFQGHTTPRMIYMSPAVGGFQIGASLSSESSDLGKDTQLGVNYTTSFNETKFKFGFSNSEVSASQAVPAKSTANETGVEITNGKWMASFINFDKTEATMSSTSFSQINRNHLRATVPSDCQYIGYDSSVTGKNDRYAPMNMHCGETIRSTGYHFDTFTGDHGVLSQGGLSESKTNGNELEVAYTINDELVVNMVRYTDNHDYKRMSFGAKRDFTPNLYGSIAYSNIDDNGQGDSNIRIRMNYSF